MVHGSAIQATLNSPCAVLVDGAGTIYIADTYNGRIRSVTSDGIIHTIAGSGGLGNAGYSGDGGPATSAQLFQPRGIALGKDGIVYIADTGNWRIRMVSSGIVSTVAGAGPHSGTVDGGPELPAVSLFLESPQGVVVDSAGNLYAVSEGAVFRISPSGLANLWVAPCGCGAAGFSGDNGPAALALFGGGGGGGVALDLNGNLFIGDSRNHRVRKVIGATSPPRTAVSAAQLNFVSDGLNNPAAQIITVNNSGAGMISWSISVSPGANWLNVNPGSGLAPAGVAPGATKVTVSIGALGLVAGTYRGSISISSPSIASPVVIPGVLSVTSAGATPGTITSVTVANGGTEIAQNAWIAIKGTNLAPNNTPAGGVVWSSAPEFASGRMPAQLGGYPVTVTVNNQPAFMYFFCSAATSTTCTSDQINVLTPLDNTIGPVQVVVTNNGVATAAFTVNMRAASPSFPLVGATQYVVAAHADYSLVGPASLSVPGYPFAPAQPGETIILYQLNVIVPSTVANGDNSLACSYNGISAPVGDLITVQR